jgi:hypothetical protein
VKKINIKWLEIISTGQRVMRRQGEGKIRIWGLEKVA